MTVIDLTHTIREDMPVYPGTEPPRLTTACTVSQCGYRETLLHMYSHTGTHMDAPAHMMDGAPTLDSFGPDRFVGRGYVLDCRGLSQIPLDLLLRHEAAIRDADFLLFCTGWDQYWGTDAYYEGFPCLTEEAARFKGLAQLIGWEFTFLTMPLKFENADGCSCRAAAIVTKEA